MALTRLSKAIPQFVKMSLASQTKFVMKTTPTVMMVSRSLSSAISMNKLNLVPKHSGGCCGGNCSGGCKGFSSQAKSNQDELTNFLDHEIKLEKNSQRKGLPDLPGWKVATEGAKVVLTKNYNGEAITLKANVNHAVDAESRDDERQPQGQANNAQGEMVCKPDFTIEIQKGDETLGINCEFSHYDEEVDEEQDPDTVEDLFHISEISLFNKEFAEHDYLIAGDVMDVVMYDLLMNLLNERGINDQFIRLFVDYCTVYEHGQYIGFLEHMKRFLAK